MMWPTQAECRKFYGTPGTGHAKLALPFPMYLAWDKKVELRSFTIHKKCLESAGRAFARIAEAYPDAKQRRDLGIDLFGGCYNNRPMRGGTQLSMHAFACAIDFDPDRNQLKWGKDRARLAKPDAAKFWWAWEQEGWISLGRTRNFDWMHVQAARL